MSSFTDRFAGMDTAKVATGQVPGPSLGKAAYLVSSVRMVDNRKGGYRVILGLTTLWGIEDGKTWEGMESSSNVKGDKVEHVIFSGDRFLQSFKGFCLKAADLEPHEEMDLADAVVPAADNPEMSELERLRHMWLIQMPCLVCARNEDGSPRDAGIFDNQLVIEVGTTQRQVFQRADKNKPDGDTNRVYDKEGNALYDVFTNSFINRRIAFEEVGNNLEEDDILRFFGTTERFMDLLQEHG